VVTELVNGGLVALSRDNEVFYWDSIEEEDPLTIHIKDSSYAMTVIQKSLIAVGSGKEGEDISVFEVLPGVAVFVKKLQGHNAAIMKLLMHKNGMYLFSSDQNGILRMWDIKSGACVRTRDDAQGFWSSKMIWFKEDVIVIGYYNTIVLRNIFSGECLKILSTGGSFEDIVINPKGNLVSCGDKNIVVWFN